VAKIEECNDLFKRVFNLKNVEMWKYENVKMKWRVMSDFFNTILLLLLILRCSDFEISFNAVLRFLLYKQSG
jgi:hypothetical protein